MPIYWSVHLNLGSRETPVLLKQIGFVAHDTSHVDDRGCWNMQELFIAVCSFKILMIACTRLSHHPVALSHHANVY